MQLKLDELIRAVQGAQNALLDIEDLTEKDLDTIKASYGDLAREARDNLHRDNGTNPDPSEAIAR